MRKSKLTLTADASVITAAKRLAAERNTSVSALFSRLVVSMQAEQSGGSDHLGQLTRRASGLVTLSEGRSDRDLLADALTDKHGLPG